MTTERLEVLGVMGITDLGRALVQAQNNDLARQSVGITVSATPPENPEMNDIWLDIS